MKNIKVYCQEKSITARELPAALDWFAAQTSRKPRFIYANAATFETLKDAVPRNMKLGRFDRLSNCEVMLSVNNPAELTLSGRIMKQFVKHRKKPVKHPRKLKAPPVKNPGAKRAVDGKSPIERRKPAVLSARVADGAVGKRGRPQKTGEDVSWTTLYRRGDPRYRIVREEQKVKKEAG